MSCPKCGDPRCEEVCDEVDIGVGVQKHLLYLECPKCGTIGRCEECGAWDFQPCNPHMHLVTGIPATDSTTCPKCSGTGDIHKNCILR